MHFLFFQNCISPHQMPYIEALSEDAAVEEVCVVVPRVTYGHRANLGWPATWTQSKGKMRVILAPEDKDVESLFRHLLEKAEEDGGRVIANFSGISAFPEVKRWFEISLSYTKVSRGIITEAPFAKGKWYLLWLHRLHFLLTDYRYIRDIQYVFAIGDDCVSYYRGWSSHWRVIPFMYCTQGLLDTATLAQAPIDGQDRRVKILFVGALEQRKNVSFIFEALKDAGIGYSLSIVGEGELSADLQRQAKENDISASFLGACPIGDIPGIMAEHDLLVLPSLHDGWGAVVNEAATVGTLTACSSQCGARSIANYVFDLKSPARLKAIFQEVSTHLTELRQSRSERIEWARREISPIAVARKMLDGVAIAAPKCCEIEK